MVRKKSSFKPLAQTPHCILAEVFLFRLKHDKYKNLGKSLAVNCTIEEKR